MSQNQPAVTPHLLNAIYVDDSDIQLQHFSELLRANGFSVDAHLSYQTAFPRLCQPGLDLAIIDFAMPGKTGLELLLELREVQPHLPVTLLTVHPDHEAIEQFRARITSENWFRVIDKAAKPSFIVQECKAFLTESSWIHQSRQAVQQEFDRLRLLHWAAGMISAWSNNEVTPEQALEAIRQESRRRRMAMVDLASRLCQEPNAFRPLWQVC